MQQPGTDGRQARWYAVWTRANHERVGVQHLLARGIEVFLPVVETRSRRKDRRVTLERPVFPGYYFVRSDLATPSRVGVLRTPGVVAILGGGGGPQAVPDWQIGSIRAAVKSGQPFEIINGLVPGKRVRIVEGPLAGIEGVVEHSVGGRDWIAVSVDILGRTLALRVPGSDLLAA